VERFGRLLREAREARGLTLEEASAVTKIRPHILAALEEWDLARAGHPAFVRGFLKSYCSLLGLDPAPFLEAFARTTRFQPASPLELVAKPVQPPAAALAARRRRGLLAVGGLLLLMALGTALLGRPRRAEVRLAELPPSPSPVETAPASSAPAPSPAVSPSPGVLRVSVQVTEGKCWLAVVVDGREVLRTTLTTGESRSFEGRVIRMVLGNAGAVRLFSGGRDLGVPGQTGEVVRIEFSPEHPGGRRL
jgi:cytoskeleton protein RodZ